MSTNGSTTALATLRAEWLSSLPAPQRQRILAALTDEDKARLRYTWRFWAREEQLPPDDDEWLTWLLLAGRGFGKTRSGAEWIIEQSNTIPRIALIGETAADARDVMIQGESGILACSPPWNRPTYNPSLRQLTWPNGAIAKTYSGDDPEQLRGPQHGAGWVDELAKYRYAQDAWDQLQMGLRLGAKPRVLITTTPRPIPLLRKIMKNPRTRVVGGSTYDNAANLSESFIEEIRQTYEGTRLGRQEIGGVLLEDTPGALWTHALIDQARATEAVDGLEEVVVAVDPTGSTNGDAAGIIAAGRKANQYYVLADATLNGTTTQWAKAAVNLYDAPDILADRLIGERNFGGDMVSTVVRQEAENLWRRGQRDTVEVNYSDVTASRGKVLRAEPIAGLYEQGRVHHLGLFPLLEDEMCRFTMNWKRERDGSPNRVDALVFALTYLMKRARGGSVVVGHI